MKSQTPKGLAAAEAARATPLDLGRLRLFCLVAELGSLTKAAAASQTDVSAISRQIGALEREWGGRLFHRTGRGLELSELGHRILPGAAALLWQAQQLAQEARSSAGVLAGEVRLAVQASLARRLIVPLALDLRRRHPGIRLQVFEGSSGQLTEWWHTGYVDIAAMFRYGASEHLDEQPLAVVSAYLVGPPEAALARRSTVPFKMLAGLPLILGSAPNALTSVLQGIARKQAITLEVVLEANSQHVQLDAVAQGCGYAVTVGDAASESARRGTLSSARIVSPGIDCAITLAISSQKPVTAAARETARTIRRLVESFENTASPARQA